MEISNHFDWCIHYSCNVRHFFNLFRLSFQKRLVLVKVTLKRSKICYFASWHGYSNKLPGNGEGPMDDQTKIVIAKQLIKAIKKSTNGDPFIIGGDFNLEASKFPTNNNIVVKCNSNNSKDYFVYGDFNGAAGFQDGEQLEYLLPLDHKPIKTTVPLAN